jgi:hypothetical protein
MNYEGFCPLLAAASLGLGACAAVQPVNLDSGAYGAALKANGISVLVYAENPIFVKTPGSVAGAGLIDDVTRPMGSKINIPSVAYLTASFLRESLVSRTRLNIDPISEKLLPSSEADQSIGAADAKKKFVLKIRVPINSLYYRPLAWSTYQYMLHVRATLIDSSNGNIIWDNVCKLGGVAEDKSLQLDRVEFKNNDGQKLKDIIRESAKRCATELAMGMKLPE